MTKINFILLIMLIVSCSTDKHSNEKACEVFIQKLNIIERNIIKDQSQDTLETSREMVHACIFMEQVTGIISEADVFHDLNIYIVYWPCQSDYDNWSEWYSENKSKIRWDNKDSSIYLEE